MQEHVPLGLVASGSHVRAPGGELGECLAEGLVLDRVEQEGELAVEIIRLLNEPREVEQGCRYVVFRECVEQVVEAERESNLLLTRVTGTPKPAGVLLLSRSYASLDVTPALRGRKQLTDRDDRVVDHRLAFVQQHA